MPKEKGIKFKKITLNNRKCVVAVPEKDVSSYIIMYSDNGGNWFVDFKAGNVKYIVFKDKILQYQIGNQVEKDYVCEECRKMGISDNEMNWSE